MSPAGVEYSQCDEDPLVAAAGGSLCAPVRVTDQQRARLERKNVGRADLDLVGNRLQ